MAHSVGAGENGRLQEGHEPQTLALEWGGCAPPKATSKTEILRLWDEGTAKINEFWTQIPAGRFQETLTSFGQYTGFGYWQVLYIIDNEVHHRGQGYVYLRALGVERRSGNAEPRGSSPSSRRSSVNSNSSGAPTDWDRPHGQSRRRGSCC